MKEIIEKILKGEHDFSAELQPLSFSCDQIDCEVLPGREVHGAFYIYAQEPAQGYVLSRDLRFRIDTASFEGKQAEIRYTVESRGLASGKDWSGMIAIISDHGEYELPYHVVVGSETAEHSQGEIRNIFHFANLAQMDWKAALDFFYSPAFIGILNGADSVYRNDYRGLSANTGNESNMERFLELTRKKTRPEYRTAQEEIETELPRRAQAKGHIDIVREGWGYTRLLVETEGDFLMTDREILTGEDFSGNVAQLDYTIRRAGLHPAENIGRIRITDQLSGQELVVRIILKVPTRKRSRGDREILVRLYRSYLSYRMGHSGRMEWNRECTRLLRSLLEERPDHVEYRLYQVQALLNDKRYEEARLILVQAEGLISHMEVSDRLLAYSYYLRSILEQDAERTAELAEKVRDFYRRDDADWHLAWVILYMDETYAHNERKCWKLIRRQYRYGANSPFMYLEAIRLLAEEPKLMEEISDFEIAVYTFALRNGITTAQIRRRFAFLLGQEHRYSEEYIRLLEKTYALDDNVEILEAMCLVLMRGNCIGKEYFKWYSMGIGKELRLVRLYEYYMMSMDKGLPMLIPRIVLMYFAHRSSLDTEHNAVLYANVLAHKTQYQELYDQYEPQIESFARDQLLKGNISDDLAYLYTTLGFEGLEEPEYRDAYEHMLFKERIRILSGNYTGIVVIYENLKEELYYPVYGRETCIELYGEHYSILLEDAEGNRTTDTAVYSRERLLKERISPERLYQAKKDLGFALYLAQYDGDLVQVSGENEEVLYWLSRQERVTAEYRQQLRLALMEYYFDNDLIAPLDEILGAFKPQSLTVVDREKCIHVMVARGFYEDAYQWLMECGTEGIDIKILVRLCDRMLVHNDQEYDTDMVKLCQEILRQGKYDGVILGYLLKYSKGLLKERKELWRAADSFGMDVTKLTTDMMLQVLYTGVDFKEKADLYLEHADHNMNGELEQAYLAMLSYDYFIKLAELDERIFDRVVYLDRIGDEMLTICILAYLKARSTKELTEEEIPRICTYLDRMHREGIFFPFFVNYAEIDPRCLLMSGRSYIEYRGKKGSHVVLHYVIGAEGGDVQQYHKEEMTHVYSGIYIHSFLLYFGERIHYYITEEDGRQEKLTRSSILEYTDRGRDNDRFGTLNHINAAAELGDDDTLQKLTREYAEKAYLTDALFGAEGWKTD